MEARMLMIRMGLEHIDLNRKRNARTSATARADGDPHEAVGDLAGGYRTAGLGRTEEAIEQFVEAEGSGARSRTSNRNPGTLPTVHACSESRRTCSTSSPAERWR